MAYTALAYSVFMTRMDAKVMPTDDTDYSSCYSCHIKPLNSSKQSYAYRVYITPPVINSLGGGRTHTYTHTRTHTHTHTDIQGQKQL